MIPRTFSSGCWSSIFHHYFYLARQRWSIKFFFNSTDHIFWDVSGKKSCQTSTIRALYPCLCTYICAWASTILFCLKGNYKGSQQPGQKPHQQSDSVYFWDDHGSPNPNSYSFFTLYSLFFCLALFLCLKNLPPMQKLKLCFSNVVILALLTQYSTG